jgi:hypothetical protein
MATLRNQDRIDDLFDQAVALPAEERGSFLDVACEGDADMKAAVQQLLAAHEQAEASTAFLASTPDNQSLFAITNQRDDPLIGQQIGRGFVLDHFRRQIQSELAMLKIERSRVALVAPTGCEHRIRNPGGNKLCDYKRDCEGRSLAGTNPVASPPVSLFTWRPPGSQSIVRFSCTFRSAAVGRLLQMDCLRA